MVEGQEGDSEEDELDGDEERVEGQEGDSEEDEWDEDGESSEGEQVVWEVNT